MPEAERSAQRRVAEEDAEGRKEKEGGLIPKRPGEVGAAQGARLQVECRCCSAS